MKDLIIGIIGLTLITLITYGIITTTTELGKIDEQQIADLIHQKINEERTQLRLQPLTRTIIIDQAAQKHTDWMAKYSLFEHTKPTVYGENIVMIPKSFIIQDCQGTMHNDDQRAECMVQLWINSPGHYANIKTSQYTQTGIGVKCTYNKCYATQNFK